MFQVRIHGRGGQGVVTAAELLSVAAFLEGKHAQAFPSFGSERTGSPVVSFCRIDDKEIRLREPILEPDGLIVQDPTLFKAIDISLQFAICREIFRNCRESQSYWPSSFRMVSMSWNEFSRAQGAGRGFGCLQGGFWEIAGKSSVEWWQVLAQIVRKRTWKIKQARRERVGSRPRRLPNLSASRSKGTYRGRDPAA